MTHPCFISSSMSDAILKECPLAAMEWNIGRKAHPPLPHQHLPLTGGQENQTGVLTFKQPLSNLS